MSARNVDDVPPHHPNCKNLHETWRWPCFPTSKDAHTLQQKAWLQANKENLPKVGPLRTEVAFNYKYKTPQRIQDTLHSKEDIELDEPEEE